MVIQRIMYLLAFVLVSDIVAFPVFVYAVIVSTVLLTFSPWVSYEDIAKVDQFIQEFRFEISVPQKSTRLLLFKGSPLLDAAAKAAAKLKEREFCYDWEHIDPRVDSLYKRLSDSHEEMNVRCCIKG